jgi:hypothetical protein
LFLGQHMLGPPRCWCHTRIALAQAVVVSCTNS